MVGSLFVIGSSVMDSPSAPCLCLDAHTRSKKKIHGSSRKLELGSSFTGSSIVFRISSKRVPRIASRRSKKKLLIVNEDVAGNYDDTFGDVKTVRTFLNETNCFKLIWLSHHFYKFCSNLLTISLTKLWGRFFISYTKWILPNTLGFISKSLMCNDYKHTWLDYNSWLMVLWFIFCFTIVTSYQTDQLKANVSSANSAR